MRCWRDYIRPSCDRCNSGAGTISYRIDTWTERMRISGMRVMDTIYKETWAILELHFLTRPHLIGRAREELAECFGSLMANGGAEPRVLKDLACRTIQLRYGPAPAYVD